MNSNGESLHLYVWDERFLYAGPGIDTTFHRNHAAVWLSTCEGEMQVSLGDGTRLQGPGVFIPSGTEYATAVAAHAIAALFWEPESASYQAAMARLDATPRTFACPLSKVEIAGRLRDPATTLDEADRLLAEMFGVSIRARLALPAIDARIAQAVHQLREAPEKYDSLDALAESVHLSPSRFAHVFKDAIGVPVRRYLLWRKMRKALDEAIAGHSLTTAALSAGFADSAHLSRTVRSMMGIAPEFLFKNRGRLVIHQ
ncbi:MAG: helix-turn-helix transcriptional regulator [Betaproteobacteria bacterium]|nr:helix-turn-helix transcriptional regulator [Betaproteobacteria bacterium]